MGADKEDFYTRHVEVVHAATEIAFKTAYTNGILAATIINLGLRKNVQHILEKYFSQVGIRIHHELPVGLKNAVNLSYDTAFEFIPGTLEVYLSGICLNGNQTDADRDYDEKPNAQGFVLLLDANKPHRLNKAPRQFEPLHVNYKKRITFNTKGGT